MIRKCRFAFRIPNYISDWRQNANSNVVFWGSNFKLASTGFCNKGTFKNTQYVSSTNTPVRFLSYDGSSSKIRKTDVDLIDPQGIVKNIPKLSLKQHLKDAATFKDCKSSEHIEWPSSSFHQTEGEQLLQKSLHKKEKMKYSNSSPHDPRQANHSDNSILLFPGQGAQFVGMGAKLMHIPTVKDLYDSASQILEYDLLSLCLEGPPDKLNSTRYCQPAIVVTSLAAVEALYQKNPEIIKSCIATAGFSVGELTSLIFGGVLSLEDGLRIVKARGEAMEYASQLEHSGMMTVFFGAKNQLSLACEAAKKWTNDNGYAGPYGKAVCQIANYLYVGAKTVAGHEQALRFIAENKQDFGIRKVKKLPVSGAFHTPLMQEAVQPFRESLALAKLNPPRISVYSNLHGEEYKDTMSISNTLPKQIVKAVKWEQILQRLFNYDKDGFYPRTYECGPGSSLSYILAKCNGKAAKLSSCTEV